MSEIIKLEEDAYVLWSNIADGPLAWGTLDEIKSELLEAALIQFEEDFERRITRVNETGTSSVMGGPYTPNTELMFSGGIDGQFTIKIENVKAFLESYDEDTADFTASEYLIPTGEPNE